SFMRLRISCEDETIGSILAGWRYDITSLSPEQCGDYKQHLANCAHCRSRQVLHRTIDIGLMIVASVSAIMFLVAFSAVRFYSPRHALVLELVALAGFLFFSVTWLIVAVATPAPVTMSDLIRHRSQRSTSPPSTARVFLRLIPAKDREYLVGDLEEEFRTIILPRYGPAKARLWFWQQTMIAIGPFIIQFFKRAILLKLVGKLRPPGIQAFS